MKKRIFAVLLVFVLAFSMSACGGSSSKNPPSTDNKEEEPSGTDEGEDTQEVVEEFEVEEPTEETAESPAYNELVPVMTYKEFEAAGLDSPVTVETYVQVTDSFDEKESTVTLFAQNEEGACLIYKMPTTQADYDRMFEGQMIRVSGKKSMLDGDVVITDATYEIKDGFYVAEAEDVTSLLGTDQLKDHLNRKVSFKGMKSVDTEDPGGDLLRYLCGTDGNGDDGDDLYFSMEIDGKAYLFMVESSFCGLESDVYQTVLNLDEDVIVDMEGFLSPKEGAYPYITSIHLQ